ncbi:MAG TPA: hypothetical protein DD413_05030 [Ruminococcus sp.]|nr:hypothetical protein [Ruminococcus sp.]
MKKSAQNRIIIWSTVSVALIIVLIAGFIFSATWGFPSINQRRYGTYEYSIDTYDTEDEVLYEMSTDTTNSLLYSYDEIAQVDIYLSTGKVIFKESDSDNIKISQIKDSSSDEAINSEGFYYTNEDGVLQIYGSKADFDLRDKDFSSSDFTLMFNDIFKSVKSKTIVAEIPRNAVTNYISINTAGADIEFDNINTDTLTINSFSGNANIDTVKSSYISVNNVSGKNKLSNITSDQFELNCVSGDAEVEGNIDTIYLNSVSGDLDYSTYSLSTNLISINTVSGDTTITLPKNSGFTVINSSLSGEIKSGFDGRQIDEHYIYGDGSIEMELNSVSGSISIQPANGNRSEQAKAEQKKNESKEAATAQTDADNIDEKD